MTLAIAAVCPEGAVLVTDSITYVPSPAGGVGSIWQSAPKLTYVPSLGMGLVICGSQSRWPDVSDEDHLTLLGIVRRFLEDGNDPRDGNAKSVLAIGTHSDGYQLACQDLGGRAEHYVNGPAWAVTGIAEPWFAIRKALDVPTSLRELRMFVLDRAQAYMTAAGNGEAVPLYHMGPNGEVKTFPVVPTRMDDWAANPTLPFPPVAPPLRLMTVRRSGASQELIGAMPLEPSGDRLVFPQHSQHWRRIL